MMLTFRPIDSWDRPETRPRTQSPFGASYSSTLTLLDRELRQIGARNVVLQVDATERDCRLDGQLRADARLASPRVILAFDSKHGPLKYHCDKWWKWQDNLRGIALGLEAQRKLERYGITSRGEQYTGWKALGAGIAMGPTTMSVEEAAGFLEAAADAGGLMTIAVALIDNPVARADAYRAGAKALHPDAGGDAADFQRLQEAKRILDEAAA